MRRTVFFVLVLVCFWLGSNAQQCTTLNNTACLQNYTSCSVNLNVNPPVCQTGAPTDSCYTFSGNLTQCALSNCFADPYVNYCFVSEIVSNYIFGCSQWNVSLVYPNPGYSTSAACLFHGCGYNPANGFCLPYGSPGTNVSYAPTVIVSNLATFSSPIMLFDSLNVTGTITIPLAISLTNPLNYVFGLSTAYPGLASQFSGTSLCNSLGSNLSTTPYTVITGYPGTAATLQAYVIQYINANGNMNFDSSVNGSAAIAYFGNITVGGSASFLTSVAVAADQQHLVFSYNQNLNTLHQNCHSATQLTYNVFLTYTNYFFPITVMQRAALTNSFAATDAQFSVSFSTTGAVTVSEAILYTPSIVLNEVVAIQGTCPAGSQQMQMTYTMSYSNVQSGTTIVGPRYISDILQQSGGAGLQQCYGDNATVITSPTACTFQGVGNGYSCATTFVMLSRCRILNANGQSFDYCTYASASDRLADLGNATGVYPSGLDGIHNFYVSAYVCPFNRSSDSLCAPTNPSPSPPDYIQATIQINDFPTVFVTAPAIQIDFALLQNINQNITQANYNSSWTNMFNATNVIAATPATQLPSINNLQRMTVAIQIDDVSIRSTYTLRMLLSHNMTLVPLNYLGLYNGNRNLSWTDIAPFAEIAPKLYVAQVCPFCPSLLTCTGVSGCDGFSIQSAQLVALSPAQAYAVTITYQLVLPAPTSRRRLLSGLMSDGTAFSATSFIFNVSLGQATNATSSGLSETAEIAIGVSIGVFVLVLIAICIVMIYCWHTRSASAASTSNSSPGTGSIQITAASRPHSIRSGQINPRSSINNIVVKPVA